MHRGIEATLVAWAIVGCAGPQLTLSPQYYCLTNDHRDWRLLAEAPANYADLLALPNSIVSSSPAYQDSWFALDENTLLFCRYEPQPNVCLSRIQMLEFQRSDTGWVTGGTRGLACVTVDS